MQQWVALLRGINVGGANKVPMAELRDLAKGLGWRRVQTLIASGNLVFEAEAGDHAADLRRAMATGSGVDVPVLVLDRTSFAAVLDTCPFQPGRGKDVHGFFCFSTPALNDDLYQTLRLPGETLEIRGDIVWLHAPDGIGRSKLAAKLGNVISGTTFTGRNLNTLRGLLEMLDGSGAGC